MVARGPDSPKLNHIEHVLAVASPALFSEHEPPSLPTGGVPGAQSCREDSVFDAVSFASTSCPAVAIMLVAGGVPGAQSCREGSGYDTASCASTSCLVVAILLPTGGGLGAQSSTLCPAVGSIALHYHGLVLAQGVPLVFADLPDTLGNCSGITLRAPRVLAGKVSTRPVIFVLLVGSYNSSGCRSSIARPLAASSSLGLAQQPGILDERPKDCRFRAHKHVCGMTLDPCLIGRA